MSSIVHVAVLYVKRDGFTVSAYNQDMLLLAEMDNHVLLQILCDALDDRRVVYRVENVAVSRMFPGMAEARVLVEERDYHAARRILEDLELDR